MARDLSPEAARQEKVDELATEHYARLQAQLQAGNAALAGAIGEAICQHMTDSICNEQMFYAVMPNGGAASPRFKKLVENALLAQAEVEALREVEQLERAANNDPDNCRPTSRGVALRLVNQDEAAPAYEGDWQEMREQQPERGGQ